LDRRVTEAAEAFIERIEDAPDPERRDDAIQSLGWVALNRFQWLESASIFESISDGSRRDYLVEAAQAGSVLSRKSPAKAAILASLVPGAGRAYLDRPGDAAFAFMLVGSTAATAVYYARRNSWTGFSIMAGVGLWFYVGDIYGSWRWAYTRNQNTQTDYLHSIQWQLPSQRR
jgi:hypothetical protein